MSNISKDRDTFILEQYALGKTQTEIKNTLGHVGYTAVSSCLKRHKVALRPHGTELKTYSLNPLCFHEAEKSELASWLVGFLLADGCVQHRSSGQRIVRLAVSEVDIDAIQKFSSLLQTNQPIKFEDSRRWTKNRIACLSVTSTALYDSIVKYGIVPRKTGVEALDTRLVSNRHAWRGVFDGDGSFSWIKNKSSKSPRMFLAGSSRELLEQFSSYIVSIGCSQVSIVEQRLKSGKLYYSVCASGRSAVVLAATLYKDSNYSLDRKHKIATEVMSHTVREGWKVRWGHA